MPSTFKQDPDAQLDYKVDWSLWLGTSETISTSTWVVDPGITQGVPTGATHDNTSATIWLSGGVVGTTYTITNHIATSAGRINDRSIVVRIIQL